MITFTGFRNPDFEKYLEELGYDVADGLTKSTTHLVAFNPDDSKPTTKIKKAKEYNIPILSIPEAYELFNYRK